MDESTITYQGSTTIVDASSTSVFVPSKYKRYQMIHKLIFPDEIQANFYIMFR